MRRDPLNCLRTRSAVTAEEVRNQTAVGGVDIEFGLRGRLQEEGHSPLRSAGIGIDDQIRTGVSGII